MNRKIKNRLNSQDFLFRLERYHDLLEKISDDYKAKKRFPQIVMLSQETQLDLTAWANEEIQSKQVKELGRRLNTIVMLRDELDTILETSSAIRDGWEPVQET
jgi:hypothetical protein